MHTRQRNLLTICAGWKRKTAIYNLHCGCAFVVRVVAESVKVMQLTYSTQTCEQIQRAAATETHTCIDPTKTDTGGPIRHVLLLSFSPPPHFLCWALTDTHTWLKTVHCQRDTAGLNGAGLITAIMERITGVHTKKKSIHKCTGRRLLREHIQGTSATKKKKKITEGLIWFGSGSWSVDQYLVKTQLCSFVSQIIA